MNKDQVVGTWEQIKGRAKMAWADLTDDELLHAEGSVDLLVGVIQKKFGGTKESVLEKLQALNLS